MMWCRKILGCPVHQLLGWPQDGEGLGHVAAPLVLVPGSEWVRGAGNGLWLLVGAGVGVGLGFGGFG
jgi:hypothetical protein